MAHIGRYELTGLLGEGGMGSVYRAKDDDLMREVAIKLIRREVVMDESVRQRFDLEAKAAGMLNHPGIVTVYDRGETHGQPYIVMELVDGRTLDTLLRSGELSQPQIVSVVKQVAAALDFAHSRQVIHRDIKPQNIAVQKDGTAKIMDFGIARAELAGASLTATGLLAGSPHYVPPERFMTGQVSGHTDQWALAVTAYQALTGRAPFHAESWDNLTYKIVHEPAPDPRQIQPALSQATSAVLLKALSKRPEQRYPSCSGFAEALEASFTQPETPTRAPVPVKSRVPMIAAASVAAIAVLAGAVWFLMRPAAEDRTSHMQTKGEPPPQTQGQALPQTFQTSSGDMVLVPAGNARFGELADRTDAVDAFYIDKTEVSAAAYRRFCSETQRTVPPGLASLAPGLPAINVTWADAQAFAAWAGKRLPTAIEWEKAARGAEGQPLPWGAEPRPDAANIPVNPDDAAHARATEVAAHPDAPSPYGAIQMLGNVWEWTATAAPAPPPEQLDRYRRIFKELDPPLSAADTFYQIRGGSFRHYLPLPDWKALVWDFNPTPARARRNDVGFRCAKDAR